VGDVEVHGDGDVYRVEVGRGPTRTVHDVTVPAEAARRLGWSPEHRPQLVRATFAFLLEREPASSILRRFDIEVVGRYFPEYRGEISRRAPPGA